MQRQETQVRTWSIIDICYVLTTGIVVTNTAARPKVPVAVISLAILTNLLGFPSMKGSAILQYKCNSFVASFVKLAGASKNLIH
jgi:hypothetical protein